MIYKDFKWKAFDIEKQKENNFPNVEVIEMDTIENFPKEFSVAITNPPYLAKNSVTRSKLPYKYNKYDDLYKKCLELMLDNYECVAAIIPESFIT